MTCPIETFPDLETARAALTERRARAALSGSPSPIERIAYPCEECGLAHITRSDDTSAASVQPAGHR